MAETKKTTTKTAEAKKTTATKTAETKAPAKKTTTAKTTQAKAPAKKTTAKAVSVKAEVEAKVEAPVVEVKAEVVAPAKKEAKKEISGPKLQIKLIKSKFGRLDAQKKTLEALGLRKINQVVTKPDNAATRGMIYVVKHLIEVTEIK